MRSCCGCCRAAREGSASSAISPKNTATRAAHPRRATFWYWRQAAAADAAIPLQSAPNPAAKGNADVRPVERSEVVRSQRPAHPRHVADHRRDAGARDRGDDRRVFVCRFRHPARHAGGRYRAASSTFAAWTRGRAERRARLSLPNAFDIRARATIARARLRPFRTGAPRWSSAAAPPASTSSARPPISSRRWGRSRCSAACFEDEDGRAGAPPVVALAHHYWQQVLGSRSVGDRTHADARHHAAYRRRRRRPGDGGRQSRGRRSVDRDSVRCRPAIACRANLQRRRRG